MSFQEKKSLVSLLTAVFVGIFYYWYVYQSNLDSSLDWANDFRFWASTWLVFIPILIGIRIVTHIVFVILNKIATNEDEPRFSDELDKVINLKATRNAYFTFMFGFLLSMTSLVIGMPIASMFIILIVFGFLSEAVHDVSKLYLYRKGI